MCKLKGISYKNISCGTHLCTGVCTLAPWFFTAMHMINVRESVGLTVLGVMILSVRFLMTYFYFRPIQQDFELSADACTRSLLRLQRGVLVDSLLNILCGVCLTFSRLPVLLSFGLVIFGVLALIFQFLGTLIFTIKVSKPSNVIDLSKEFTSNREEE